MLPMPAVLEERMLMYRVSRRVTFVANNQHGLEETA